eukprot:2887866-Pleurochrysis_carterae.AAC.1
MRYAEIAARWAEIAARWAEIAGRSGEPSAEETPFLLGLSARALDEPAPEGQAQRESAFYNTTSVRALSHIFS